MATGQDRMLVNAIKSQPATINLSNKGLTRVPSTIGSIVSIKCLILKNNSLSSLPMEIGLLTKLEHLNLGNNTFYELPSVFQYLKNLNTLHLFNNHLETLHQQNLVGLKNLRVLNLNNNRLKVIPSHINRLSFLEILSLNNNLLCTLPREICHLSELRELNLNSNCLKRLPSEIAFLQKLIKLRVQKNHLEDVSGAYANETHNVLIHINSGLCQCSKLQVLDLAGNLIRTFPAQLFQLSLKEFYCEENNLLQHVPVHSVQESEVLSLKEITARYVLTALKDSTSSIRYVVKHFPELEDMLKKASYCVFCQGPFLNTWLECVRFIDSKKVLHTATNAGLLPIRGYLCSYKCFNNSEHDYFGIAQVPF